MAYMPEVKKSKQLHSDLFILVGNHIPRGKKVEWDKFITKAEDYLNPADIAKAEFATDILRSMETKAYIRVGDYDNLRELLNKAELQGLAEKVKVKAAEITEQIQLETGGPQAYQTNEDIK